MPNPMALKTTKYKCMAFTRMYDFGDKCIKELPCADYHYVQPISRNKITDFDHFTIILKDMLENYKGLKSRDFVFTETPFNSEQKRSTLCGICFEQLGV
jgi:actin-related protein